MPTIEPTADLYHWFTLLKNQFPADEYDRHYVGGEAWVMAATSIDIRIVNADPKIPLEYYEEQSIIEPKVWCNIVSIVGQMIYIIVPAKWYNPVAVHYTRFCGYKYQNKQS